MNFDSLNRATDASDRLLPDSVAAHPILRMAPDCAVPYIQLARLDRPVGWWLLLAPCWQSSALAAAVQGQGLYYIHLLTFMIGAIAMRGAGSTYNDIIDRDIDAKVARTRGRPLPSGRLTPRAAKLFLLSQCLIGLATLFVFNGFTIALGFASILIVLAYPFMKRVTSWPQAVLGLAFSWGALMGWAAIFAALAPPAFLLYAAAFFWTIGYDTIYAMQDVRDDAIAGVRSTARLFGARARAAISMLYLCAFSLAAMAIFSAGLSGAALASAALGLICFGAHLLWQVATLKPDDPRRALQLFRANRDAGLLLFFGLLGAAILANRF